LGATLVLNVAAAVLLLAVAWAARRRKDGLDTARDPVCGMTVDVHSPAAVRERDGTAFYFCSPRCAERFDADADTVSNVGEVTDPVCGMTVDPATALSRRDAAGVIHYFCCEGCRASHQAASPALEVETGHARGGPGHV
jgi:Cu+-exporting ATPase